MRCLASATISCISAILITSGCFAEEEEDGRLHISLQIVESCEVVGSPSLDFGAVKSLAKPVDGRTGEGSQISIRCPTALGYSIGLDKGSNQLSGDRRLKSGSDYLTYELYQDAEHNKIWGETPDTVVSSRGDGSVQTFHVYGRVMAQADLLSYGIYSDTVSIILTY